MTVNGLRTALVATGVTLMLASSASAQVFGTFNFQMQPYCNVVTMTITQIPTGYTLDGFDDQCASVKRASLVGMATVNPDGTVGVTFTIVTAPAGKGVHVSAVISPVTGSGTWTDSVANTGTFVLAGAVPGLPPRPLPTSGVSPATITAVELAPAAVGATQLAANAVTGANVVNGSLTTADLADGPRAGFSSGDQFLTLTGTAAIVRSVTITAPAAGRVLVNASGYAWAASAAAFIARCSITTGSTIDASHLVYMNNTSAVVAASDAFGATRGFTVSAGSFTANLVCDVFTGNAIVSDTSVTALFVAQ